MRNSFIACVLIFLLSQCVPQKNKTNTNGFDYDAAWREVAAKNDEGLPESALKIVIEIGEHAKAENNSGQLVKVIIHQLKLADVKEENAYIKNLERLRAEVDQASFPVKPLLHSMLGELYWRYYQNNRYKFHDRSATVNVNHEDIETWDLSKIFSEALNQYKLSLGDADKSKNERIDVFEPVVHPGNSHGRTYRPTLYDFLAHRALAFFISDESNLTQPTYAFVLDRPEYMAESSAFADLSITSKDSLSMKFHAFTIFQDLTRFHLNDANRGALVDVELQRLNFVRRHLTSADKDDLYYKALEQLETRVKNDPIVGIVVVQRARVLVGRGSLYRPLIGDAHKWDLKNAYQMCEEGKKLFPESDGAILCENLQYDLRSKSIEASIERHNIPGAPFRSLIRYRNITDVHYRIIKITRDEIHSLQKRLSKNYNVDEAQKFIEYFIDKAAFKNGVVKLPDDGDLQEHSRNKTGCASRG
jgi:hypothetical protein